MKEKDLEEIKAFNAKQVMLISILTLAMKQVDSILEESDSQRFVLWKNTLTNLQEEVEDSIKESI